MDEENRRHWTITGSAVFLGAVTALGLAVMILSWNVDPKEQPGNVVNAVVAAANMAFVIFTWAVFKAGQDQLAHLRAEARAQARASDREYETARQSYEESVKTRLDQSAPRVSVTLVKRQLRQAGMAADILPGATFAPHSGRMLTMELTWQVFNWGDEPILIDIPSSSNTGRRQLNPKHRIEFSETYPRTVSEWSAEPGLTCEVETRAEGLSRDVLDRHVWRGQIQPFTTAADGSITAVEMVPETEPVARRERFYPGFPQSNPLRPTAMP